MIQKSYYWAYIQKKTQLKKTHAPQCPLEHYLQHQDLEKLKCPLTDEWIKKMWYIYPMEYCLPIKKEQN